MASMRRSHGADTATVTCKSCCEAPQLMTSTYCPQVLPASAVAGKYRLYLPAEFVASARLQPGTVQVCTHFAWGHDVAG